MILDRIEQANLYASLSPHFAKAFAFLRQDSLTELAEGRHDIDGENIYAVVLKGTGTDRSQTKLEVHRKYIDIQYLVAGCDDIGWKNYSLCKSPNGDYDSVNDLGLLEDRPTAWVSLCPGDFAILFPEDAHAPGAGDGELHKVVVKVAV